jgi:hypothetical protein
MWHDAVVRRVPDFRLMDRGVLPNQFLTAIVIKIAGAGELGIRRWRAKDFRIAAETSGVRGYDPIEYGTCGGVLPKQIVITVVIKVAGGEKLEPAHVAVIIICNDPTTSHEPDIDLSGRFVLPDQIGVAVVVEVKWTPEIGPNVKV